MKNKQTNKQHYKYDTHLQRVKSTLALREDQSEVLQMTITRQGLLTAGLRCQKVTEKKIKTVVNTYAISGKYSNQLSFNKIPFKIFLDSNK